MTTGIAFPAWVYLVLLIGWSLMFISLFFVKQSKVSIGCAYFLVILELLKQLAEAIEKAVAF